MALVTANGRDVLYGTIELPLSGAWYADLFFDNEDATGLTGPCQIIVDGGFTLNGTSFRSAEFLNYRGIRVMAGAAGLGNMAKGQDYQNTSIGTVLRDLLRAAGETLSSTADAPTLATPLAGYTVFNAPVGRELAALFGDQRIATVSWRMLPDGTLWVGPETWPDSGLVDTNDFLTLAFSAGINVASLGIESPNILPGTLLNGRKVSYIEYKIQDGEVRARAAYAT